MFIKINTGSDRRLVKAVRELLPDEFSAERFMATATVIYIDCEDPLSLLDSHLDRLLPHWRTNPSAHAYRQGDSLSKELMLLRVRGLCVAQHPDLCAPVPAPVVEPEPVVANGSGKGTLATLYQVPVGWLVRVSLGPVYYAADVSVPTEQHVRRPERVLSNPVRCGKCSVQVESNKRGAHAGYHGLHTADIEWTSVTRLRRE